jgi:hypothetical protein
MKPFIHFSSEHTCFGLTNLVSFTLSWKDAETGRKWQLSFGRTNYGRWGRR